MGPYFIEYKDRKVLLNYDPSNEFLESAIQELKNHDIIVPNDQCRMELYNKEFDVYYSIKETDLPEEGLVKLIFDNESAPTTSGKNNLTPSPDSLSLPYLQPGSQSPEFILFQDENENMNPKNRECKVQKWPKQFIIEDRRIPDALKNSLHPSVVQNKKERSALLDFLYQEITRYTYYPTHTNYNEVATALLRKFPHLQECSSFSDAKELWKIRLSTKARNSRRRKDQSLPAVAQKRARRDPLAGSNAQSYKSKPAYGAPNYLPKKPSSEDEASIQRHINFLKCESGKAYTKDIRKIEVSMKETFNHRRELIVLQNITIPALKKIYPTLFDSLEICYEFMRITEFDIIPAMRSNLLEHAEGILEVASTAYEMTTSLDTDDQKDLLACTAVSKIPILMKENLDFTAAPSVPSPMVVFDSPNLLPTTRGRLIAEGEDVCVFEGPLLGMAVWLASYYCFDRSFPKFCSKTLKFLQRAMLGMKDGSKAPLTVMTTFHKIQLAKKRHGSSHYDSGFTPLESDENDALHRSEPLSSSHNKFADDVPASSGQTFKPLILPSSTEDVNDVLSRIKECFTTSQRGDEFDIVGRNVASKMRKMSPNMQIVAEKIIDDILYAGLTGILKSSTKLTRPCLNQSASYNETVPKDRHVSTQDLDQSNLQQIIGDDAANSAIFIKEECD